jgi:hypothetical protein
MFTISKHFYFDTRFFEKSGNFFRKNCRFGIDK